MNEKLISPQDYTPPILLCVQQIKHKMDDISIDYTDDDIRVFEFPNGDIYILGNPVMGEEPIFNIFGQIERFVPMRNITIEYPPDVSPGLEQKRTEGDKLEYIFHFPKPHLHIIAPFLLMKILSNGEIISG